jgi:hypothetical protein
LTHEGCTPKREASSSAVSRRAVSVLASDPGAVVVPAIALLSNGSALSPHTNRSPSPDLPGRLDYQTATVGRETSTLRFWSPQVLAPAAARVFCSVRHASA